MSEKKQDALQLFREIYTVPAIPEKRIDDFKKSIEEFINNGNFNYTLFKIKVLSEYVVNIDLRLYKKSPRLPDVSYLAYELKGANEDQIHKIKKWLRGIYIFTCDYKKDYGVVFKSDGKEDE